MAELHLKSGAAGVAPYANWTNGAVTLADAVAAMAAGDTVWLSKLHAQATAGLTITIPGTTAALSRLIGGTEGGSTGLTDVSAGAVVESTNTTFSLSGNFFADRITWRVNTASTALMSIAAGSGNVQWHRDCRFEVLASTTTANIKLGCATGSVSSLVTLERPIFKWSAVGQRLQCEYNVRMFGGSIDATGTAPTGLFALNNSNRGCTLLSDDFDATNMAAAGNLVTTVTAGGSYARIRRIKLPAAWTGAPVSAATLKQGDRVEMIDAVSGSTIYRLWIMDHAGSVRDESAVKVTAQASSRKMVSSADCSIAQPLRSGEYFVPLSGSAQTLSLDVMTDGTTLTDQECHMEVDYLPTAGSMLGTVVSDQPASSIATPAAQPASSTTWTSTGLSTPIRQTLSVSVTAGSASAAIVRVVLTKPSTTVFVADTVTVA